MLQVIVVDFIKNDRVMLIFPARAAPKLTTNLQIPQSGTTVRDLKRAIQRNFTLRQQRLRSKTKISWRYVWRTYDLLHWGKPMGKDGELVSAYGVVNKSEIRFGKKLRGKAETC
jgi:hypothetical protein